MAMDSAKREAMIKENSGAFRSTEKDGDEGRCGPPFLTCVFDRVRVCSD